MTTPTFAGGRQTTFRCLGSHVGRTSAAHLTPTGSCDIPSPPLRNQLRIRRKRDFSQYVADVTTTGCFPQSCKTRQTACIAQSGTDLSSNDLSLAISSRTKVEQHARRQDSMSGGLTLIARSQDRLALRSIYQQIPPISRRYQTSSRPPTRSSQPATSRASVPSKSDLNHKVKLLPSRPNGGPSRLSQQMEKRDEMVIGVIERDRQKVNWNAIEMIRRGRLIQLESRVDTFMKDTISLASETRRARLNQHLRPLHEFDTELDLFATNSRAWAKILEDLSTAIQTRMTDRIDRINHSIELFVDIRIRPIDDVISQIHDELSMIHADLSSIQAMTPRDIRIGAEAKIRLRDQEKSLTSKKRRLWNDIETLTSTIVSLVGKIRELKARAAGANVFQTQLLDQAYAAGVLLARPHTSGWDVPISHMAHILRDIEMRKADAIVLPELGMATRWAALTAHRYVWPIRSTSADLRNLFDVSPREDGPSRLQLGTKKFKVLKKRMWLFATNTDKILDLYTELICGGITSLCPHPKMDYHLKMVVAFRPFEMYYLGWDDLMSEIAYARAALGRSSTLRTTSFGNRLHATTMTIMDRLLRPPQGRNHPLSRRGYRSDLFQAQILHGARLIMERNQSSVQETVTDTCLGNEVVANPGSQSLIIPDSMKSAQWLENESLYPAGASIMIDFIKGFSTLRQIVDEIRKHKVISFDLITSRHREGTAHVEVIYFLFASPTNIYIVDSCSAVMRNGISAQVIRTILEDPSILKICTDSQRLIALLWTFFSIDIKSVYDLQRHNATNERWTFRTTMSVVESMFKVKGTFSEDLHPRLHFMKERAPAKFFLYLAMRAYAPLRLFHVSNNQANVRTVDTKVLFTLGNYYDLAKQYEFNQLELGPVNIDRSYMAFEKLHDSAGANTGIDNRGAVMHDISYAMARSFLQDRTKSKGPQRSPTTREIGRSPTLERNIAAYYLFTTFGETLSNISAYLDCKQPSACILSIAKSYNLRLNPEDKAKLLYVVNSSATSSQSTGAQHSSMVHSVPIENQILEKVVISEQSHVRQRTIEQEKMVTHPNSIILAKLSDSFKTIFSSTTGVQERTQPVDRKSSLPPMKQATSNGRIRKLKAGKIRSATSTTPSSKEISKTSSVTKKSTVSMSVTSPTSAPTPIPTSKQVPKVFSKPIDASPIDAPQTGRLRLRKIKSLAVRSVQVSSSAPPIIIHKGEGSRAGMNDDIRNGTGRAAAKSI